MRTILWVVIAFVLYPTSSAFAANTPDAITAFRSVTLFAFIVAAATHKRKIGGWLMYYYIKLYLNFLILLWFTPLFLDTYRPSAWGDDVLYSLYLVSMVPNNALIVAETLLATMLLFIRYRSARFVKYLKYVLLCQIIVGLMTLFVDYNYFSDNLVFTAIGFATAIIWYLYFSSSFRVYWVFENPEWEWNYELFRNSKVQGKKFKIAT